MKLINDEIKDLDKPIDQTGWFDFLKKGKLRCYIFYEDGSYSEFFKKFDKSYRLEIKKRTYFVTPDCIVNGKQPFIAWYFNNPMPLKFKYQRSELTGKRLLSDDEFRKLPDSKKKILTDTILDSEGCQAVFNTNLLQGLYAKNDWLTGKNLIIMAVVAVVIVLIILQLTGTVDVIGEVQRAING